MVVLNEDSLESADNWLTITNNALYTAIDFISQLILVSVLKYNSFSVNFLPFRMKLYRCWIMWCQPLVMVIPCLLSLGFLGAQTNLLKLTDFRTNFCIIVTALTTLGFNIKIVADNVPLPNWYFSAVTAFFFLSLGVNAVVTALIVYRIITVFNDIRGFNNFRSVQGSAHRNGQLNLSPLISILIESGLITFVGQLTQSIMYKSATFAFPLVSGCVVMLYVRPHLVFLMIFLSYSYLLILLRREFRRQLSLCVWRWVFPTIVTHQGRRIQRIRSAPYN